MSSQLAILNTKHLASQICLSPLKIETERLFIRPYQAEDFEKSVVLYGDEILTRYFDHGLPRSKKEVRHLIKSIYKIAKSDEFLGLFSIFSKENMSFIGHIDCLPTIDPGIVELGYILHTHSQNRGFCSEAVKAFLFDYIPALNLRSNIIKIDRVIATVHPENIQSKKIIEKMGMHFEKFLIRFGNPRMKYFLDLE